MCLPLWCVKKKKNVAGRTAGTEDEWKGNESGEGEKERATSTTAQKVRKPSKEQPGKQKPRERGRVDDVVKGSGASHSTCTEYIMCLRVDITFFFFKLIEGDHAYPSLFHVDKNLLFFGSTSLIVHLAFSVARRPLHVTTTIIIIISFVAVVAVSAAVVVVTGRHFQEAQPSCSTKAKHREDKHVMCKQPKKEKRKEREADAHTHTQTHAHAHRESQQFSMRQQAGCAPKNLCSKTITIRTERRF
jgi:hypothetical protein